MKKIIFLFSLITICSANCFAQKTAVFYGVDFSLVKVCGANESDAEFALAFERINDLFISQSDKYDIGKSARLTLTKKEIAVAKQAMRVALKGGDTSQSLETHDLLYEDPAYDCRDQIDAQIAGYQLAQTEGLGLVIIANMLDKAHDRGSFYFVTFDIASRNVETCIRAEGKPGGFGLRNFWAGSLHKAMKNYYKRK